MFKKKYFIAVYQDAEKEELVTTFENANELAEFLKADKRKTQYLVSNVFTKKAQSVYGYYLEFYKA